MENLILIQAIVFKKSGLFRGILKLCRERMISKYPLLP
ncbi:hypothetical protein HPHPP4D_0243 [Helicobacter pylori Hp P-4d]|uniref:Uncharacterized protein n=1 Tax=Helicobacter pylori Hp P-4 TaxID=992075 RepID=J0EWT5_HELPX|nr:hypothetical protein HPHPP4_0209 [Helicobacter pylori Hp P-4]EJC24298.1 hypothetical protein HPHPP4C_0245 [Helicobacter pylori Hp P-4c]EJC25513.1 hypothetical protein HPHPP4D_0243 [Helicobacter pylori Hp P-4d]